MVLTAPLRWRVTPHPDVNFPEAVVVFVLPDGSEIVADLCTPIHDSIPQPV